jgi:hypothetical protein
MPSAKQATHLRLERGGEQAVDIMVAVVDEDEAAIAHVAHEVLPLGGIELHQRVPGQVAERRFQHARVGQRHHVLLRVHAQRGVVDQRGDQVDGMRASTSQSPESYCRRVNQKS